MMLLFIKYDYACEQKLLVVLFIKDLSSRDVFC